MAQKLDDLVKKVIFGATAAISVLFPSKAEAITKISHRDMIFSNSSEMIPGKNLEISDLILYKSNANTLGSSTFHRSHRSHSSHRSHYSSYTEPSKPKTDSEESSNKTKSATPKRETVTEENKTSLIKKLGSRQLSIGMEGTDVGDLQDILIKKGFKDVKVTTTFDKSTENAVKAFQKSKKIAESGIVDILTLWHLMK